MLVDVFSSDDVLFQPSRALDQAVPAAQLERARLLLAANQPFFLSGGGFYVKPTAPAPRQPK